MNRAQLTRLAREHWAEWRPKAVARMKKEGTFAVETQKAAARAQREIRNLMDNGFQAHEAEEVVLPQYILLKPEEEANEFPEV